MTSDRIPCAASHVSLNSRIWHRGRRNLSIFSSSIPLTSIFVNRGSASHVATLFRKIGFSMPRWNVSLPSITNLSMPLICGLVPIITFLLQTLLLGAPADVWECLDLCLILWHLVHENPRQFRKCELLDSKQLPNPKRSKNKQACRGD